MILDEILKERQNQLSKEKAKISQKEIEILAAKANYFSCDFAKAIGKKDDFSFICEIKKSSPSKGLICADFDPEKIAKEYEKNGANAISVLTEEKFFLGKSEYLTRVKQCVKIPVLRKDFIFDEYQLFESKAIGADAILLISKILSTEKLSSFIKRANNLGLNALVEVHDNLDFAKALDCGAKIIGINNRNLENFKVDIQNTINLLNLDVAKTNKNIIFVSESGIKNANDVFLVKNNGCSCCLIGETLMKSQNISKTLQDLREFL